MGSHWDAVVGQDLPDAWGHWSHHTHSEEARYWKIICEAVSKELRLEDVTNGSVDGMIYCLALGNKFVMHQTLHIKEDDQHYCNFD
jgi:hypothetical protein